MRGSPAVVGKGDNFATWPYSCAIAVLVSLSLGGFGASPREVAGARKPATQSDRKPVRAQDDGTPAEVQRLTRQLRSDDWQVRDDAMDALFDIGLDVKGVLPALVSVLKNKDEEPNTRGWVAQALGSTACATKSARKNIAAALLEFIQEDWQESGQPGHGYGPARDDLGIYYAIRGLADIAKVSAEARKTLVDMLKHPNAAVRARAAFGIGHMRYMASAQRAALAYLLADRNAWVRYHSAQALMEIGPNEAAVPALIAALGDGNSEVRDMVRKALRRAGPVTAGGLIQAMGTRDKQMRRVVIELLARQLGEVTGPATRKAIPPLAQAMRDNDAELRLAAVTALGKLSPEDPRVTTLLLKATHDDDKRVRVFAFGGLAMARPTNERILAALVGEAKGKDEFARLNAVRALGEVRPVFRSAMAVVLTALEDKDAEIRAAAVWAASSLSQERPEVLGKLIKMLKDSNSSVRSTAVRCLKYHVGPEGGRVALALIECLKDESPRVRKDTFEALMETGPVKPAVLPLVRALPQYLKDLKEPNLNRSLDQGLLWKLLEPVGKEGGAAVPALAQLTGSENREVRKWAIGALGWVGPPAKAAVPALLRALKDKDSRVRMNAAYSLSEIGAGAEQAIPVLIHGLTDTDEDVRSEAATALGNFGPRAAQAVPYILSMLKDHGWGEAGRDFSYSPVEDLPAAARALVLMGPPALPMVRKAADAENPDVRAAAVCALASIKPTKETIPVLTRRTRDDDWRVRVWAGYALAKMGLRGNPGTTCLVNLLKEEHALAGISVARMLADVGVDEIRIPALIEAVTDKQLNPYVRVEAVRALGRVAGDSRTVVRALASVLSRDEDEALCGAVLTAMGGRMNLDARDVLASLVEVLKHNDWDVRCGAVYVLRKIAPDNPPALSPLVQALKDRHPAVRQASVSALAKTGAKTNNVVRGLLGALEDKGLGVRKRAVVALGKTGVKDQSVVRGFARALLDMNEGVRLAAAEALGNMGPSAADAIPALTDRLKDDTPACRVQAALALARVNRSDQTGVRFLIKVLRDGYWPARADAAKGLGKLGPAAKPAIPALREAVKDKDEDVRKAAATAMIKMGAESAREFIQLLKHEDDDLQRWAASVLVSTGPLAVPHLIQALSADAPRLRAEAALILGDIGPAAKGAATSLKRLFKDEDVIVRTFAAVALSYIDPGAKEGISALVQWLKGGDEPARRLAAGGLGAIGPDAKAAVPALTQALNDENEGVRQAAAVALRKIQQKKKQPPTASTQPAEGS